MEGRRRYGRGGKHLMIYRKKRRERKPKSQGGKDFVVRESFGDLREKSSVKRIICKRGG